MKHPLISIIIATFNSEKTLRNTLESVCNQVFQEWECLIVDGASKDKTLEIIHEYEAKDPRIRHISEPDKGIYDAFNKGWKLAKGEWIHYLGSDDKLTKNSFIGLIEKDDPSVDVISGSTYIEKTDGKIVVLPSIGWEGCHQAKICRKSVLEAIHGFDESYPIKADKELFFRMERAGYKVVNDSSVVAYFAMDGMSQNLKTAIKRLKEDARMYKEHPGIKYPKLRAFRFFLHSVLSVIYRKIKLRLHL